MKAIAVHAGTPNSIHLRTDVPEPKLDDIAEGNGVLVKVVRVGVDGTDRDINDAKYGKAPEGADFLITGHENFGQVLEAGPNVGASIRPGGYVVATVRRPGHSPFDAIGMQDMTTDDVYYERGINLRHGYLTERYVDDARFIVPIPDAIRDIAVLLEPLTVSEKGIYQASEIQRRLKIWRPMRAAVLGAGTIGLLATLALRLRGIDVMCYSKRPAPYLNSNLIGEIGATYVNSSDLALADAAKMHGPVDNIFEATGYRPLVFDAAQALAKNGVPRLLRTAVAEHPQSRRGVTSILSPPGTLANAAATISSACPRRKCLIARVSRTIPSRKSGASSAVESGTSVLTWSKALELATPPARLFTSTE